MEAQCPSCRFSATAIVSFVLVLFVMTSPAQCYEVVVDVAESRPAELRFQSARNAAQAGESRD